MAVLASFDGLHGKTVTIADILLRGYRDTGYDLITGRAHVDHNQHLYLYAGNSCRIIGLTTQPADVRHVVDTDGLVLFDSGDLLSPDDFASIEQGAR